MSSSAAPRHILKPARSAGIAYMWDFYLILAGIIGLAVFHKSTAGIAISTAICLFGVFQLLGSRHVLRTHFIVTENEVSCVNPRYSDGIRWEDICDVVIRERPQGIQVGRADHFVILTAADGRKLPLNTSVLSPADEDWLLRTIQGNVHCPIHRITDGPVLPGREGRRVS